MPMALADIVTGSVESILTIDANVGAMRRVRSVRPYEGGSRRMPAPHEPSRSAVSLPADVGTSMAAKASPIEIKAVPKRRRAMPPLNPDLIASAAVGSAALAAQERDGESD